VESGRSFLGSLQNVGGADAPSTAAKSVKKVHGCITGIGAFQLLNSSRPLFSILFFFFVIYSDFLLLFFYWREGFSIIHLPGYLLFLFFYSDDGYATYFIYFSRWGFLRHCTDGCGSLLSLPYFLFISIGSYAPMWASTDNEDHDIPGSISFCTVMIIEMVILWKLYRQFMKSRLGSLPSLRYKTKWIQSRKDFSRRGKVWNGESVA